MQRYNRTTNIGRVVWGDVYKIPSFYTHLNLFDDFEKSDLPYHLVYH